MKNGDVWTMTAARMHLGGDIGQALADGPQTIKRHGRPMVVVVLVEAWDRTTTHVGKQADFFAALPLRGPGLDFQRLSHPPRDLVP